jgi:hypothetical protein
VNAQSQQFVMSVWLYAIALVKLCRLRFDDNIASFCDGFDCVCTWTAVVMQRYTARVLFAISLCAGVISSVVILVPMLNSHTVRTGHARSVSTRCAVIIHTCYIAALRVFTADHCTNSYPLHVLQYTHSYMMHHNINSTDVHPPSSIGHESGHETGAEEVSLLDEGISNPCSPAHSLASEGGPIRYMEPMLSPARSLLSS